MYGCYERSGAMCRNINMHTKVEHLIEMEILASDRNRENDRRFEKSNQSESPQRHTLSAWNVWRNFSEYLIYRKIDMNE